MGNFQPVTGSRRVADFVIALICADVNPKQIGSRDCRKAMSKRCLRTEPGRSNESAQQFGGTFRRTAARALLSLPHVLAPLALQNKAVVYGLLFRAAADTLLEIAADPKHLGARIGFLAVLHTWGQTLRHRTRIIGAGQQISV